MGMTVKQLIRHLHKLDDSLEVVIAVWKYKDQVNNEDYEYYVDNIEEITTADGERFVRLSNYSNLEGN